MTCYPILYMVFHDDFATTGVWHRISSSTKNYERTRIDRIGSKEYTGRLECDNHM